MFTPQDFLSMFGHFTLGMKGLKTAVSGTFSCNASL